MPYAEWADTARLWATERAIGCWVWIAGDLDAGTLARLRPAVASTRADGANWAVVAPRGMEPSAAELDLADEIVVGAIPPQPWGVLAAMQATGVSDVRRLGVLGASRPALEAGQRAGAGAVIALADADPDARMPLLLSQPDAIVTPDAFAALDAERYGSSRAHRQRVLLNPGPSVVSDRVHRAVGGPDLCLRELEYGELLAGVRRKLLAVAGVPDDWAMVMLAGSGTAALEAMIGSSVRPGKTLLVARNGVYGERVETIARRLGIPVVTVEASDIEPIDPAAVAAALDADDQIDAAAVIHHETTTGLLNPVAEIAAVAQARGVPILVDAISSLGAEELALDGTGIDFVASTSNKCLHGLPGAAFVLVSPRGQERITAVPHARSISTSAPTSRRRRRTPFPLRPASRRSTDSTPRWTNWRTKASLTAKRGTRRGPTTSTTPSPRSDWTPGSRRGIARARCERSRSPKTSTTTRCTTG